MLKVKLRYAAIILTLGVFNYSCLRTSSVIQNVSDQPVTSVDGLLDAELFEAELSDAEVLDAEKPDAELPDVELLDAELPDAELADAELPDAELPDAEPPNMNLIIDPQIKGFVEDMEWREEPLWRMTGWTCQYGSGDEIMIDIYAGGGRGVGTWLRREATNVPAAADVLGACGLSSEQGGMFRFNIPFTSEELSRFAGQMIYVYGVNPDNLTTAELQYLDVRSLP